MKIPRQGSRIEALKCLIASTLQRFGPAIFSLGLLGFALPARAQYAVMDTLTARSVSGQFVINASSDYSPLYHRREIANYTNLIRLEPALLAVSAERFKTLLWQQLDLKPGPTWRGKIFLVLRPAQSINDGIVIASGPILQAWDYRLTLPDVVSRTRYARALSAALLLEIANRNVAPDGRSAEIPAWLADGCAQLVLDEDVAKVILSPPAKAENGLPESRLIEKQRGIDPLSSARVTLQRYPALIFDQLSWPTDAQVNGDDGGIYLASAQLFVQQLLNLKDGPQKMRALLAQLPGCLNWQKAFFAAFHDDFQRPLDVEKWWSLRVIDFSNHNFGAQWTVNDSNDELADLLSVPVEIRTNADSLPVHGEISLQTAILNFTPQQRESVLRAKMQNFETAQFRLATPFAVLAAGYRAALSDFLGNRKTPPPAAPVYRPTATSTPHRGGAVGSPMKKDSAASYNAALADYVEKLKKNPQIVQAKPAQTAGATKPVVVNQPAKKPAANQPPKSVNLANGTGGYSPPPAGKSSSSVPMLKRASIKDTLKKLDELDVQRRELLAQLNLDGATKNVASARP